MSSLYLQIISEALCRCQSIICILFEVICQAERFLWISSNCPSFYLPWTQFISSTRERCTLVSNPHYVHDHSKPSNHFHSISQCFIQQIKKFENLCRIFHRVLRRVVRKTPDKKTAMLFRTEYLSWRWFQALSLCKGNWLIDMKENVKELSSMDVCNLIAWATRWPGHTHGKHCIEMPSLSLLGVSSSSTKKARPFSLPSSFE